MPCEGIFTWRRRRAKPDALRVRDAVLLVCYDGYTRIASEYGPVPDARQYPVPGHPDADAILARRFAPDVRGPGRPAVSRYPFPAELLAIPRDRSAVIEASAGTGKTFLIEHLVVDRLLRGGVRLDEILVVTFTDRATAELVQRIRALIAKLRRHDQETPGEPAWLLDDGARARLAAAEQAVDGAPISTIHAFCRRILTEHAFASGRLLAQQNVESRTAFSAAFHETLRDRLAIDPELAPLPVGLAGGGGGRAASRGAPLQGAPAAQRLGDQLRSPGAGDRGRSRSPRCRRPRSTPPSAPLRAPSRSRPSPRASRSCGPPQRPSWRARDAARLLAAIDELVAESNSLFTYLASKIDRRNPRVAALVAALDALADAAVPLATAVAQRLGPPVVERLAARQRTAGRYDFDDMLTLVRDALGGPRGPALVATLRARYRLAIIDEFQDTDPIQWEIFRTMFQDSAGENPLYLIGDPKQSIYGFRGADIATYNNACATVAPPAAAIRLSRNFRSTPAVIDGYNAILDPRAHSPFFNEGVSYHPVTSGRRQTASTAVETSPPVVLLRVTAAEDVSQLPMRDVRATLARAIADEIAALLAGPRPPPAREIFVLTRTRRESDDAAAALTARGVPYVIYNQEGLYETPEARHVRDLLHAIADPHDPEKRLRA